MKKILLLSSLSLIILATAFYSFTPSETIKTDNTKIQWLTIEQAMEANDKKEKKILIDMYTDWCGWCKVMDQKTFTNPKVIRYINENFYAVKFNAEQRESVTFKGKKYDFIPSGRRGVHGLAYTLLDRNASYPSFVVLDENLDRLGIVKGYKQPEAFINILDAQVAM